MSTALVVPAATTLASSHVLSGILFILILVIGVPLILIAARGRRNRR